MAQSAAVGHGSSPYKRLRIYSTRSLLYVVGFDESVGLCRVLRLNRQDAQQLDATQDPDTYTPEEANAMLLQLQEAAAQQGGLQLVCEGHGIIGCFRFTDSYYLLVITRREYVGHICGHKVYKIAETAIIPLSAAMQRLDNSSADSTAEKRYRKLLAAVDLTRNFFFSYSYSLAHTLQRNHTGAGATASPAADAAAATAAGAAAVTAARAAAAGAAAPHPVAAAAAAAASMQTAAGRSQPGASSSGSSSHPDIFDSMFVWNAFLTRALRLATGSSRWAVPLIHGFWEQRVLSVFGRQITVTLLARRSRHFAGTRFRKRGINDEGKVANEVETEQIVDAGVDWATGQPLWSAVVQLRGSIPLYWSQQASSLSPKPDIVLQRFDPLYRVTQRHFDDLRARYGNPIVALNLLKARERRPREMLLRKEFAAAVSMLNDAVRDAGHKIAYIPWDFQQWAKQPGANILLEIASVMRLSLDLTGIFVHNPAFCHCCAPSVHQRRTSFAQRMAENASSRPQRRTRRFKKQQQHTQQQQPRQQQVEQRHQQNAGSTAGSAVGSLPFTCPAPAAASSAPSAAAAAVPAQGIPLPLPAPKSARPTAPRTQLQHGVLRTNCIDCLDRTNVAQFAFGLMAFGRQLHELQLLDGPDIDSDSSAALHLMEMYELMGHELALQYGGSEAHAVFFQRRRGEWEAATQSRDLLTSIRRFYSNAYTDSEKQDAINLFLGNYVPGTGKPALWELDSDYYLHSGPWAMYGELMAARQLHHGSSPSSPSSRHASALPSPHGASNGTSHSSADSHASNSSAADRKGGQDGLNGSSGNGSKAVSPFAGSQVQAAASAAMGRGPPVAREGNPLLALTYSDGITIDAPDSSPSVVEAGWDFRLVFQLRAAQAGPLQLFPSSTPGCQLLSLDRILAKQPRVRPARLYPAASSRSNVMWDAVQQAFTFFAAANDGTAPIGSVSSDISWEYATPPGSPAAAGNPPANPSASTPAAPSRLAAAAAASSSAANSAAASAATAVTDAALGPELPAASPASGGFLPDQLLSALGQMRPGARAPQGTAVPVLNDFLEIRRDVPPVRYIKKPQPPTYGVAANRWLDVALEQVAWASLPGRRPGSQPPVSALNDIIEIRPAAAPAAAAAGDAAAAASGVAGNANGAMVAAVPAVVAAVPAGSRESSRHGVQPAGAVGARTSDGANAAVGAAPYAGGLRGHEPRHGVASEAEDAWMNEPSTSSAWPLGVDEEAEWVVVPGSSAGVSGTSPAQPSTVPSASAQQHHQQHGLLSGGMEPPTLDQWLHQDAASMGLVPEVAAVWLGSTSMGITWGVAKEKVSIGYRRYASQASAWQLLEPHSCAALHRWYERQVQGGGASSLMTAARAM